MMKTIELKSIENLNYGRREAMNSLKTNIQFAGVDIKTVVVTSHGIGEGKTTVSFDLARSLAESGKDVLFIDADMRKSQLVSRYKIDSQGQRIGGLTHYLSGQAKLEEIICGTNISGMHIILSGPFSVNPTELLNSNKFEVMINALEKAFDFVIIDMPPLGSVIDAAIIAPKTDGVIVILEANSTSTRSAQKLIKQLEVSGARVLGFVLNKVSVKGGYYTPYKYYGK